MPNTYTPQTWVDNVTDATEARFETIESGIQGAWARELSYVEKTSETSVTATTEGTANTIVTAGAITFDGSTAVIITFFAPRFYHGTATGNLNLVLYEGSSAIGTLFQAQAVNSFAAYPLGTLSRRLTPTAGSKTYSVRGYTAAGTATVGGGAGGAGNYFPAYIRIERA